MFTGNGVTRPRWFDLVRLLPVVVLFVVPLSMTLDRDLVEGASSTSTSANCPDGVGRGGDTASSGADTYGGEGCVVFEYDGQYTTFTYSGAVQSWTVPAGVASVVVHAIGAGGGGGRNGTSAYGGGGGYATGRLSVTPGQQFDVIVGGGGRRMCAADVPALADVTGRHNFSFGGGGAGNGLAMFNCSFAAGGGRSAVREAGAVDDLVTAGGGGGGGYVGAGGGGGGLSGGTGGGVGGGGGTQSAGGVTGGSEPGVAGIKYAGGWAGYSATDRNAASEGGGGGGGYYGGGAAGDNGGGGGGSSYLGALTSASTSAASGRNAAIGVPSNSSAPVVPANGVIGASITAAAGTWTYDGTSTFKWQFSETGSSYADIVGASGATYVPNEPGFVRLVETKSNVLGSATATSGAVAIPDSRLSALVPSVGALSPSFSSAQRAYTMSVGYRTRTLRLTPTASAGSATVRVAGTPVVSGAESSAIDLGVGDTAIVVRVEVGSAATETTITVTRAAATAPGAPTITSITPGDGQLTVAFDAPADDGGEAIDRFEYSVDGGPWVPIDRAATSYTVAGLTNGTDYAVRMRAVSVIGNGTVSAATTARPTKVEPSTTTSSTTTTLPVAGVDATTSTIVAPTSTTVTSAVDSPSTTERVRRPARALPAVTTTSVEPTSTTSTVSQTTVPQTTVLSPTTTTEAVADTTETIDTTVPPSEELALIDEVAFELVPEFGVGEPSAGARVRARAAGLAPNSVVRLEVHSDPVLLAEGTTDASGSVALAAALPGNLAPGAHMLSLSGTSPNGKALVSVAGLEIDAQGVISGVTAASGVLAELPNDAQVTRMAATGSAPYDASNDAAGAAALAGAAVVLLGIAGAGGSKSNTASDRTDEENGSGDEAPEGDQRDESAEGSLASAEAKILKADVAGRSAWGDRSRLWALPGWGVLQTVLAACVRRVERWSTLAVRILQDGVWCRSVFGVAGGVPWLVGVVLGVLAARSVDGLAVPPAFGFVVAIVVVSFVDALAGLFAWLGFTVVVVAGGGVGSWFDVRTLLGLGALFVALPLIAASIRPLLRQDAAERTLSVVRVFDYCVVPVFLSYAAASVYSALNGLSGLEVVVDSEATTMRWLCLCLAAGRMLAEEATLAWFPTRRAAVALSVERAQLPSVSYVNIVLLLGIYVLTAGPYMGMGPRTWLIMGLMCVVPVLKTQKERLPNARFIHRWLPRGILRSVVMLYAVAYYGRWILEVTGADAKQVVPLMLLPGIAVGVSDCFGRSGGAWPESRWKNIAGALLWMVSLSVVAGWLTP